MTDIKFILEKLKNRKITSEEDCFDFLRLYFCDHINEKVEILAKSDNELALGLRDASTIHRLGIMAARTPKEFMKSVASVISNDAVVELLGKTRSAYIDFILRRGEDFIRSECLDLIDNETKNRTLDIYRGCADTVTEKVLFDHSTLPGLIDNTYNLSVFRLRELDSTIDKCQRNLKQLKLKIKEANGKCHFDEEDQLTYFHSKARNQLQHAENIKIRAFCYNDQIVDDDIDDIATINLREQYCHSMQLDAGNISNADEKKYGVIESLEHACVIDT
jgi:hypothetical protein